MYYHGQRDTRIQTSKVAVSKDGLEFKIPKSKPEDIPGVALRYFKKRDFHYLLGEPGLLFRSNS
jgi:hypothetical protein